MATRYHVNPATGRPNLCNAKTPDKCLYYNAVTGKEAPHFATKTEARKHVEKLMQKEYGVTSVLSKGNNAEKESSVLDLDKKEQIELIKNDELSFDELEELAKNDNGLLNEIVYERIIRSKPIPHSIIDLGISNGDSFTKEIISQQSNLKPSQVKRLNYSNNKHVKGGLAGSDNLFKDDKIMISLLDNENSYVASTAWGNFENKMLTDHNFNKTICNNPSIRLREIAAQSQNLLDKSQVYLATDPSTKVRTQLAGNYATIEKTQRILISDREPIVRSTLAKTTTNPRILDKLAFDIDDKTLENAINNPYISVDTLDNVKNEETIPLKYRKLAEYYLLKRTGLCNDEIPY